MASNSSEPPDSTGLIERYALVLYRYHLALRGERPAALALTAATLRTALAWLDTFRPAGSMPSLSAWIFAIARYKQAYTLRRFSSDIPAPPTGRTFGGILAAAPDAPPLWQAQLAMLAESLRPLPVQQGEALALFYFGGLGLTETAATLHKTPAQVEQHLQNRLAGPQYLRDLANDIVLSESEHEMIRRRLASAALPRPSWRPSNFWPYAYGLRRSFSRVVPAAVLALLLLAAFIYFNIPVQVKSAALQATAPALSSAGSGSASPAGVILQGYLVPPNPNECSYWQNYLDSIFKKKPDLIDVAPFQNPLAKGPDESGTACELDLTSLGPGQRNMSSLGSEFQSIQPVFARQNYQAFSLPSCGDGKPDGAVFCRSTVFTHSQSGRALLIISGRPLASGSEFCPTIPPNFSTPLPICRYFSSIIEITMRLQLAASPVQPVLADFLSKWTSGSNQVVNHLSGRLRASLPDLPSLDKLANIDRGPAGFPSFSWRVIDNSGNTVLIELQVDEIRTLPLPSHLVSTVQLQFVRSKNDWLIQSIQADPLAAPPAG